MDQQDSSNPNEHKTLLDELLGLPEPSSPWGNYDTLPPPAPTPLEPPGGEAEMVYDRMKTAIDLRRMMLSDEQDLLITFTVRSGETLLVSDLGHHGPNLLFIFGTDIDGNPCTVLTHPHGAQLILRVVSKDPDEPRRRISFHGEVEADERRSLSASTSSISQELADSSEGESEHT